MSRRTDRKEHKNPSGEQSPHFEALHNLGKGGGMVYKDVCKKSAALV